MKSDHYYLQRAKAKDQNHDKVVMVKSKPISRTGPESSGTTSVDAPANQGVHSPNCYENATFCEELPGWRYIVDLDALEVLQVHNQQNSPKKVESDPQSSQVRGSYPAAQRTVQPGVTDGHGSADKDVHGVSASQANSHEIALTTRGTHPHHTASKPKHNQKVYEECQSEPDDQVFSFSPDHVRAYLHEQKRRPSRNRDTNHYEPVENSANYRYDMKEIPLKPNHNRQSPVNVQQNELKGKYNDVGKSKQNYGRNQTPRGQQLTRDSWVKDPIYNDDGRSLDILRQHSPCFRYRMQGLGDHGYERYDIISNHETEYNHGHDNHGFQSADVSVEMKPRVSEYMVPNRQEPTVMFSRQYDQDNPVSPVQETARVLLKDNLDDTSQACDNITVCTSCPREAIAINVPGSCLTNAQGGESDISQATRLQRYRVYPEGTDSEHYTELNAMPQVHAQNRRPTTRNSLRKTGRVMIDVSQNTFKKIARQLSNPAGESKNYDVALPVRVRKPSNHSDLALFSCICCLSPFGVVALVMAALTDIRYREGDVTKARKYSRLALIFGITGIICTIVIAISALAASAAVYYSRDH